MLLAQTETVTQVIGTPLQNFGVAVGMLVILLGFLFTFCVWLARTIVSPSITRHFCLIDVLIKELQDQGRTLKDIDRSQQLIQQAEHAMLTRLSALECGKSQEEEK